MRRILDIITVQKIYMYSLRYFQTSRYKIICSSGWDLLIRYLSQSIIIPVIIIQCPTHPYWKTVVILLLLLFLIINSSIQNYDTCVFNKVVFILYLSKKKK